MASAPRVPLEPPERLSRTVGRWEGEAGRDWLRTLPALAEEYLDRWKLTPHRVLHPGGHLSMVILVGLADGSPAALKLGLVTSETRHEATALTHWNGLGAVRLLRAEPERGALLLERLSPEVSLRSLPDAKAMLEAAGVLRRLWTAPAENSPFPSVAEHTARLAENLRERAARPWAAEVRPLAEAALELRERLIAEAPPGRVVLHGDFHHGNVLAGERLPWLAIDPKPLVGDPVYDLAWLARDRLETLVAMPAPQAAARRRIAMLADALDVGAARLRDWTFFRTVEAGVWSLAVGERKGGELALEFAAWL